MSPHATRASLFFAATRFDSIGITFERLLEMSSSYDVTFSGPNNGLQVGVNNGSLSTRETYHIVGKSERTTKHVALVKRDFTNINFQSGLKYIIPRLELFSVGI